MKVKKRPAIAESTQPSNDTPLSLRTGLNFRRGGLLAGAAIANAMAWTPSVQAQMPATVQTGPTPTTQMPQVVVSGVQKPGYNPGSVQSRKYTEPLRDVPQSVTVIPATLIQEQNATSLTEVLRNVPGISMQAGEGGGGPAGDSLSIRGFNARNDIFIDGIRDFGGYSRDPFNFEQVDVVKGPASAYAGRGSTGGSINVVSKTPRLDNSFYNATAGGGTDNYKHFTLDVNQRLTGSWFTRSSTKDSRVPEYDGKGNVVYAPESAGTPGFGAALRLNAMGMESDVAGREHVNNSRWGIAPSLALEFGENTRITLSYFHMEQDNVPDYGIPWLCLALRMSAATTPPSPSTRTARFSSTRIGWRKWN